MRICIVVLLVLVASPLAAAPTPPLDPTLAALARLSGTDFDVAFMRTLLPVHEEAVEIAMAATLNADHTELLKWNQVVVERKNAQIRQLLTWLREAGAAPGQRNAGVATPAVKKLRGLKDAALERAYIPMMASHLERSVALSRLAATKANRPELRAMAQEILRAEGQEVTMLRGWLKKWYPEARARADGNAPAVPVPAAV